MSDKYNYAAQAIDLDFGGETPYAFGHLAGNKRLNDEIFRRAIERARSNKMSIQTIKEVVSIHQRHPPPEHYEGGDQQPRQELVSDTSPERDPDGKSEGHPA